MCVSGFLKFILFGHLSVCVSPPPRLLIASGMIWTLYDWLTKVSTFYVAVVSVLLVGVALALMRVVKINLISIS